MATKTKSSEQFEDGAETVRTAASAGAEAFKNSFEKATKGYDQLFSYGKQMMEAYLKSANAAGKGVESFHNEIFSFSKQAIEDNMAAAKALMASKSAHEVFELQTDFAKQAFDTYVGEATKLGEIVTATTKDAIEPLQTRMQAWMNMVNTSRAA